LLTRSLAAAASLQRTHALALLWQKVDVGDSRIGGSVIHG
jgi:hypothetical protein